MNTPILSTACVAIALVAALPYEAPAQDLKLVGGPGGSLQSRACPAGSVMTGFSARVGAAVDAVGIKCRPVQHDGSLGPQTDVGTMMGGSGGTLVHRACPQGHVVAGQRIALGALPLLPSAVVHRVGMVCRAWDASSRRMTGGTSAYILATSSPIGKNTADGTEDRCPTASQPARTLRGRAGMLVDAAGLSCSAP